MSTLEETCAESLAGGSAVVHRGARSGRRAERRRASRARRSPSPSAWAPTCRPAATTPPTCSAIRGTSPTPRTSTPPRASAARARRRPAQFPGIDCSVTIAGGQLGFSGAPGSILWLVRSWDLELPWGRDGENAPINAAVYPVLSLSNCPPPGFAIQFKNDAGQAGFVPFDGCRVSRTTTCASSARPWSGKIVSLGIYFAGGGPASFDWIRLRRPDAPAAAARRRPCRPGPHAERRRWVRLRQRQRQPVRHGRRRRRARPARHRRGDVRQRRS